MNKTIYVRDEDVATWERAKELAGDKLAPVIIDGLRSFVAKKEAELHGFERIEIQFRDSEANDMPAAKAFVGRWIFPREEPLTLRDESMGFSIGDFGHSYYAVAQTAKRRIVVFSWAVYAGDAHNYRFQVFDDLDVLKNSGFPRDVTAAIVEALGVEIEELDI